MDDALRALEMEALAGDAQAYRSLGRALIRAGRFREAKSAFRKYMDSDPHFTPEEYKHFIQETASVGTIFQPLPDFATYTIAPTSRTCAAEVHRLRADDSAVYQPLAVILGKNGKPKTNYKGFTVHGLHFDYVIPEFLFFGSLDFEHYFLQGYNELEDDHRYISSHHVPLTLL